MQVKAHIRDAVASFESWDTPWQFRDQCLAALKDDEAAGAEFRELISCAKKPTDWAIGDWKSWESKALHSLQSRFPGHDAATLNSILRAVSYEWR